jgi:ribonuclease E
MFSPTVTLKSGGYIVINQTEALVSIDVNSGRATREHSIEETARKTNLEAADEVGRQLRLRDLAGLIVIDFIDMEDSRNDRDVERRIREAVKNDRARVQIGKISQFGLLEMSRQRLRAGVIAGSTVPCPHCGGQGIVRSVESTALRLLRGLEEEGQKLKATAVVVRIAADVAIYTLNQKRRELGRIETDYGMTISFEPKEGLMVGTFEIERTAQKTPEERAKFASAIEAEFTPPPAEEEEEAEVVVEPDDLDAAEDGEAMPATQQNTAQPQQGSSSKRRRRRRGGRGRSGEHAPTQQGQPPQHQYVVQAPVPKSTLQTGSENAEPAPDSAEGQLSSHDVGQQTSPGQPGAPRKRRRRRGRRGGSGLQSSGQQPGVQQSQQTNGHDRFGAPEEIDTAPHIEPVLQPRIEHPEIMPNAASTPVWSLTGERGQTNSLLPETNQVAVLPPERTLERADAVRSQSSHAEPSQPAKKGWWQRTFRSDG